MISVPLEVDEQYFKFFKNASHLKRPVKFISVTYIGQILDFIFLIKKHKIDVVFFTNWIPYGVLGLIYDKILKIPYFLCAHGKEVLFAKPKTLRKKVSSLLQKLIFNKAKKIFAVSNFTKNELMKIGVHENKISVIKNGVNIYQKSNIIECNEIKDKYGLSGKQIILTVARLDVHKGQDMVLKALPSVLKLIQNAHYVIVGTGSEEGKLRNLINDYGLNNNVTITGFIPEEELKKFYSICDIFIMTSRYLKNKKSIEGFGLTFLEANSFGKPVIGGNTGGIPDAIVDGETGLLVDPENVQEISESIIKLLSDKELSLRLGENGKERVSNSFTWERIVGNLREQFYK